MTLQEVGVIIPTYNEASTLRLLLKDLREIGFSKICIVDGKSEDKTVQIALSEGVQVCHSEKRARSFQLNLGSKQLTTKFYLFLHSDVRLLNIQGNQLLDLINDEHFGFGSFKLAFDSNHWFLKLNEKFSHLKFEAFQFGDQGLLVNRKLFEAVGGYDESLVYMEGNEIIRRLRKKYKYYKFNSSLLVSARKYKKVGAYRLQFSYFLIYFFTRIGFNQKCVSKLFKSAF